MAILILIILVALVWYVAQRAAPVAGTPTVDGGVDGSLELGEWSAAPLDPQAAAHEAAGHWIQAGQSVRIAGREISGGMIYTGTGLRAIAAWRAIEPALIDPTLDVDWTAPAHDGSGMGYWPSYDAISPNCRAAYLEWLGEGRCDPEAYIGYVFLFFYGIERRLLCDAVSLALSDSEVECLIAEVRRLLSLYGSNGSFGSYAGSLLRVVTTSFGTRKIYELEPDLEAPSWDLPLDVRTALGQAAADDVPVPARWALAWYLGHPETSPRTAARRCLRELRALFEERYAAKWGAGVKVKSGKRDVQATYHPASPGFGGEIDLRLKDVPEIARSTTVFRAVAAVAEGCVAGLDAFSRFVGRNPDARDSIVALALLPTELLKEHEGDELQPLRAWVKESFEGEELPLVAGREILERWPTVKSDRMSKREAVAFSHLLERLGFALQPDVRFGGTSPTADSQHVLFRFPDSHQEVPSQAYLGATVLLRLATIVAAADGTIAEPERHRLEGHLERVLDLEPAEELRLRAHLRWLLAVQPGMMGMKKRIATLDDATRQRVASFAVSVAAADGVLDPREVKILQKIYGALGFDADDVFSDIHALSPPSPAVAPVTVSQAEEQAGYRIPPPRPAGGAGTREFLLDADKVSSTLAETAALTSLLAGVFTEDEPETQVAAEAFEREASPVEGLGPPFGALLKSLSGLESLDRADFDGLAADHGLLPDGAIDALNEFALGRFDEPLLEGDDPIEVNRDTLEAILQ